MVTITAAAAERVKRLCGEQNVAPAMRLATIPGGCSDAGFQYAMQLGAGSSADDLAFEAFGVRLLVDPASYPLLQGAAVDYEQTLMRVGFTVRNPNAVSTCTCGRSFKIDEAGGDLHTPA